MNADYFLDTNILVSSFDNNAPARRDTARNHFYDNLIVASALQCGARILYSEDLQEGRRFGDLEIRNPFARNGTQPRISH